MVLKPCILYQSIGVQGNIFLPDGKDFLCPSCKSGSLVFRDYCKRICKLEAGGKEWYRIPRHQCNNPSCKKIHRMLPDFLAPFKHYAETVVSDVLDEIIVPSESDNRPSEQTAKHWNHWLIMNEKDINGLLKSIAHRELDFSVEFLKSGISLLSRIRSSIKNGWLKAILRIIYNSGNRLQPFYA